MPDGALIGTGVGTYTVADLCALALQQLGVGAQGTGPSPADLATANAHLNLMLGQWQRRRWMIPALVDIACVSTGSISYAVGAGRALDTGGARPDRIEAAYVRWLGNGTVPTIPGQFDPNDFSADFLLPSGPVAGGTLALDYTLTLLDAREDYVRLGVKNLATWPSLGFYSPDYPYGTLYLAPVPVAGVWEVHVVCKQVLGTSVALADVLQLPGEYQDAVLWSLAEKLAPSYGQGGDPALATIAKFAAQARQTIRQANTRVPLMQLDPFLLPRWGGAGGGWWGGCGGGGNVPTPPLPVQAGKPIAAGTWVVGVDYVGA